jgi:hypothetical protein
MSHNVPSEKDPILALALAGGQSITEVAEQAGLDRRTITRKLADPAFRCLVAEFRGQLIATALGYLAENMTRAARAIADLLDSPQEHIRLRAARTLITAGLRVRDSVELADQVRDLQAQVAHYREGQT